MPRHGLLVFRGADVARSSNCVLGRPLGSFFFGHRTRNQEVDRLRDVRRVITDAFEVFCDKEEMRTRRDQNRPLLQTRDPRKKLQDLMDIRDPLYREIADHVAETDGASPRSVARSIRQALES